MAVSGSGDNAIDLFTHSYTAILLTGLIPTTSHDALTPIVTIPLDVSGDVLLSRVNRSPDVSLIPESISSLF